MQTWLIFVFICVVVAFFKNTKHSDDPLIYTKWSVGGWVVWLLIGLLPVTLLS